MHCCRVGRICRTVAHPFSPHRRSIDSTFCNGRSFHVGSGRLAAPWPASAWLLQPFHAVSPRRASATVSLSRRPLSATTELRPASRSLLVAASSSASRALCLASLLALLRPAARTFLAADFAQRLGRRKHVRTATRPAPFGTPSLCSQAQFAADQLAESSQG